MDDDELRVEGRIAWLKDASPDDWHRAALDFNWSEDISALFWIVRQPDCDKATALTIFWLGTPAYYLMLSLEDGGLKDPSPVWEMLKLIAQRFNANGYVRSEIAYKADDSTRRQYEEIVGYESRLAQPPFKAQPAMYRSIRGRTVVNDAEFYQRYPEPFHLSVLIELPAADLTTPEMREVGSAAKQLINMLIISGFAEATLPIQYMSSKPIDTATWTIAILGLCALVKSVFDLRTLEELIRSSYRQLELSWLVFAVTLSVVVGAALSLGFQWYVKGYLKTLGQAYGANTVSIAATVAGLLALWLVVSIFTRLLMNRKAIR